MEPHGQEPVAPMLRRNPPKLQSSFAKASEDTRVPQRSGDRGFLRRRVKGFTGVQGQEKMLWNTGANDQTSIISLVRRQTCISGETGVS